MESISSPRQARKRSFVLTIGIYLCQALVSQEAYVSNPFVQPNDSTLNWYGSGDANGDDTLTWEDVTRMQELINGTFSDPDERLKTILTEAVALGNAAARSITFYPRTNKNLAGVEIYPDTESSWIMAFSDKNVFFTTETGGMDIDALDMFHYNYTAVTPAMAVTIEGAGSDYAISFLDGEKNPFDGAKEYKLHIPANVPVNDFWAITIYDTQTRSLLQTDQKFPTVGSQTEGFKQNEDGSFDVFFSPSSNPEYENNWLQTIPGKSFIVILRVYGPLKPWIEKTWRPGEVMLVE